MTRIVHRIYLSFYVITVIAALILIGYFGFSFYKLPIEERFYHADYALLKPSGLWGHGFGIVGSLLIVVGVFSYMARKRLKIFTRLGLMKYWLEFHIFLCALGPVLILYHTSFKFGGIVSVSFWSLVAVVVSGVAGRFIYLQIPHNIEGHELSLREVEDMKDKLVNEFKEKYDIDISNLNSGIAAQLKSEINSKNLTRKEYKQVKQLINNQRRLIKQIERLDFMQNIFKYWHVAHLPFALIMLVVMIVHILVVITLGYKWIF